MRFAGHADEAILEGIRLGGALADAEGRAALNRRLSSDGRKGGRKRKSERDEALVGKAKLLISDRDRVDDPIKSITELARLVRDWYNFRLPAF